MSKHPWPSVLRCLSCDAEQLFLRDQMIAKLGELNMLRRNAEPGSDVLSELWLASVDHFCCGACGKQSMQLVDDLPGDEWGESKCCEDCDQGISAERIEVFPNSTRCAGCQSKSDRGEPTAEEVDYCPHCGSIREMRQSQRGGLTGYRMYCSGCRR